MNFLVYPFGGTSAFYDLKEYCGLDTYARSGIWNRLHEIGRQQGGETFVPRLASTLTKTDPGVLTFADPPLAQIKGVG
jgi:hypothetical protein